jgi:archaeal flagellar protein FlaJ
MEKRVPLMLLSPKLSKAIAKPVLGVGNSLSRFVPGMKYDLQEADLDFTTAEYLTTALINGLIYFIFLSILLTILATIQEKTIIEALRQGIGYGILILLLLLFALVRYPKIIAGKKAEQIDKSLLFALKDLLLQIGSGVSLYNGLVNVAKAGYGQTSTEFEKVAKAVNTGTPLDKALERMAVESKSDFLRRTTWQLINALKAGASLKEALRTIIDDLTRDQREKIKNYAQELNLWSLLYMLFAVAIPTIGATMMVILSSFAGFGITPTLFIVFITITFIVQLILIGFVKTRRPIVSL